MDGDAMPGFHEFVVARYAALLRTAYVLTGSQLAAEDLVQTALAKTAARWSRLSDPGELDGYVRRVMYHEQISLWRRTVRIRETATSPLPEPPGADHSHRVELAVVVGAALSRLTVRQRAVLTLRYFDDVDESGAAHILGVSVGTVRSQTAKALARLRILAPELQQLTATRKPRT